MVAGNIKLHAYLMSEAILVLQSFINSILLPVEAQRWPCYHYSK